MRKSIAGATCALLALFLGASASPAQVPRWRCPGDSVRVGTTCVDTYEASVWTIPSDNPKLLRKVRLGRATLQDLTSGGAVQLGAFVQDSCSGEEYGAGFPVTGNWTAPVYAVSVAGTPPSSCITWYQAEQACRLADKRLLTNAEWQAAAAGTPDPGTEDDGVSTCATASAAPALSGARAGCISNWGAHDMVGNLWEWVANWTDQGVGCANFAEAYGGDISCAGGNVAEPTPAATPAGAPAGAAARVSRPAPVRPADVLPISPHFPAAMTRGGNFAIGLRSGVFATYTGAVPFSVSRGTGFRCGR